jgi:hypothetical protein
VKAFLTAAEYLRTGVALLDNDNKWSEHYNLALEMHVLLAEMEFTAGNCKTAEALASELIEGSFVEEGDKLPLYYTLMRSAGDRVNLKLALDTGIHALSSLGVTVPRNPTPRQVQWHMAKTKRLLKGLRDEDLLNLPKMTERNKITAMSFLRPMLTYSWVIGANDLVTFICLKGIRLSLRYGSCDNTPAAFANAGMLWCSLGKTGDGFRFAKLAMQMLDKNRSLTIGCRAYVVSVTSCTCMHWRRPLVNVLDPLLEGYRVGLIESGDIEWASQCAAVYCGAYTHVGLPLEPFTADARKFIQVFHDFDQAIALIYAKVSLQFSLNLMGQSEDPLTLTGETMDEEVTLRELRETKQSTGMYYTTLHQMQLQYIMGDIDVACKHCRALWALQCMTYKGHFIWDQAVFFSSLVEFAYARKHGAKKPPIRAMKLLNDIWADERNGAVNQHPMRMILESEAATFAATATGKDGGKQVRVMFDRAISTALRSGLSHFAAIANERAAEFMLSVGDEFWGQSYLTAARDCYSKWGAEAKAAQIEAKYNTLLSKATRRPSGWSGEIHLRGVERDPVMTGRSLLDLLRSSTDVPESLEISPFAKDSNGPAS